MKPASALSTIFASVLLLFSQAARAREFSGREREPRGLEQDFLLRVWETADGLLPTNVRSIAQTRDGYVWLAAFDGFVRFDGARAVVISGKSTASLPAQIKATRVFADSRDRLWGVNFAGRVFSQERQVWKEYGRAEGWPGLDVTVISEGADGQLLFSGERQVLQFADGRFSPLELPPLPPDFRSPLKAIHSRDGALWLVSPTHVWRRESGGWELVLATSTEKTRVRGATPGRESGLWIATDRDLRRYVGREVVTTHERPADFQSTEVEMLEDFHGNLWVGGTNVGLRVWMADGRVIAAEAEADGLGAHVASLFEDRERNVLVGTTGAGLVRFKPRPFAVWLGRLGGLAGTMVNTLCEEAPGRMLVGTEGSGLRRIDRDAGVSLILGADNAFGPKHRVTSLVRTRAGEVFTTVSGLGLFRVEGNVAVPVPAPPLVRAHVRSMFEDSRKRLWIGHDGGLAVRRESAVEAFTGAKLTGVRGLCEDETGVLWIVSNEGLSRIRGEAWEAVAVPELPEKKNLLGLAASRDGGIWVGVESMGVLRFKDGHGFLFTAAHGLPVVSPGAFVEEPDNLWLSGERGLLRVSRASLDAVAAGRANWLEFQLFNRGEGLPSDACRRGYQPAMTLASDGSLWFATHKGAVSVRPQEIVPAAYEPPAVVEEIRAERLLLPVTPTNREHLEIPAGTRHMTIRVAIPSLGKPEYAQFQYRLQGFDDLWHEAGSERVIRFYDLAPGAYRFDVRAVGTDGRFVEPPASVAFAVQPLFWQRKVVRALALLALLALVAFAVWRSQQARILRQEEKLREQEERARLEAQLQQSQKMEAIGRLAGGIAHDFNNLLTTVSGSAELLQMDFDGHSPHRGLAEDIATAASRARELIGQILTFSRQRPVTRQAIDVAPVVREALRLLRAGFPAMIELRAEVPETLPPILGDAAQIQRVVMNLGTNAAQAVGSRRGRVIVHAGEVRFEAGEAPETVPPGHYVRLTVQDDGRGMDRETLQCIFDPFFTTKAVGEGTGLGLSVVHGIVQAHDGFTTVQSQPEKGAIFQIYLPVTEVRAAPAAPAQAGQFARGNGETILLVDDEESVLRMTRTTLEKLGYRVDALSSPAAALDKFAKSGGGYRLLITDFAMPDFDGVELARRIWRERPGFPVILYSGYGSQFTPHEAVEAGFVRLIAKPFTLQELSDAVAKALR